MKTLVEAAQQPVIFSLFTFHPFNRDLKKLQIHFIAANCSADAESHARLNCQTELEGAEAFIHSDVILRNSQFSAHRTNLDELALQQRLFTQPDFDDWVRSHTTAVQNRAPSFRPLNLASSARSKMDRKEFRKLKLRILGCISMVDVPELQERAEFILTPQEFAIAKALLKVWSCYDVLAARDSSFTPTARLRIRLYPLVKENSALHML